MASPATIPATQATSQATPATIPATPCNDAPVASYTSQDYANHSAGGNDGSTTLQLRLPLATLC